MSSFPPSPNVPHQAQQNQLPKFPSSSVTLAPYFLWGPSDHAPQPSQCLKHTTFLHNLSLSQANLHKQFPNKFRLKIVSLQDKEKHNMAWIGTSTATPVFFSVLQFLGTAIVCCQLDVSPIITWTNWGCNVPDVQIISVRNSVLNFLMWGCI